MTHVFFPSTITTPCAVTVGLYEEQAAFLTETQEKYSLPNLSKTLRVLLQYAATDGDTTAIFGPIRCTKC